MVRALLAHERELECVLSVEGGATLEKHWNELGSRECIESRAWDLVVIQELSTGSLHDFSRFRRYAKLFVDVATSNSNHVWLYETWARKEGHPAYQYFWSGGSPKEMQARVSAAYDKVGDENDVEVVEVGSAWLLARQLFGFDVHDEDLHHANLSGAYLSACVFAAKYDLPAFEATTYRPEEVSETDASLLRQIARAVIRNQAPIEAMR